MTAGSSAGTHSGRKLQPYMGGGRFQRGSWAVRGAANLKQSPPPKARIGSARHQAIVHLSRARLGLCFRPNRDRRSGQKTFGCAVQNSKSGVAAMRIEHAFDGRHPFSAIMARPSRRLSSFPVAAVFAPVISLFWTNFFPWIFSLFRFWRFCLKFLKKQGFVEKSSRNSELFSLLAGKTPPRKIANELLSVRAPSMPSTPATPAHCLRPLPLAREGRGSGYGSTAFLDHKGP